MRSCLACGVSSWGPLTDAGLKRLAMGPPIGPMPFVRQEWRQCDNCGAPAREELLTDPVPLHSSQYIPPEGPIDPLASALSMFKTAMPPPETRTERLVRAMLGCREAWLHLEANHCTFVEYVRLIEAELDGKTQPEVRPDWATLSWATRATFVEWVLQLLDRARQRMHVENVAADFNINRLASHLADGIEGKLS